MSFFSIEDLLADKDKLVNFCMMWKLKGSEFQEYNYFWFAEDSAINVLGMLILQMYKMNAYMDDMPDNPREEDTG